MKKMLLATSVVLLMGSIVMAQATNVVSVNVVGYTKVDVQAGKPSIVAVPFNPISTNTWFTLDELLGTNKLAANFNVANAAQVYLWTAGVYATAWLNDGTIPSTNNANWKWCYKNALNQTLPCAANTNYNVEVGAAFWLINKGFGTNVVLLGQVPHESSIDTPIPGGVSMFGNPYPVDKPLDDLINTNDGAVANFNVANADQIYLWTTNGYATAWLNDGTIPSTNNANWKWCYKNALNQTTPCVSNSIYTISPGKGFWYIRKGTNFVWSEPIPYTL